MRNPLPMCCTWGDLHDDDSDDEITDELLSSAWEMTHGRGGRPILQVGPNPMVQDARAARLRFGGAGVSATCMRGGRRGGGCNVNTHGLMFGI